MHHNRISNLSNRIASLVLSTANAPSLAVSVQPTATSMVMVPLMGTQPNWQAELYRRAYEKAVADLAPPRHLWRFFSVWN